VCAYLLDYYTSSKGFDVEHYASMCYVCARSYGMAFRCISSDPAPMACTLHMRSIDVPSQNYAERRHERRFPPGRMKKTVIIEELDGQPRASEGAEGFACAFVVLLNYCKTTHSSLGLAMQREWG
jgi:hypothetical protein